MARVRLWDGLWVPEEEVTVGVLLDLTRGTVAWRFNGVNGPCIQIQTPEEVSAPLSEKLTFSVGDEDFPEGFYFAMRGDRPIVTKSKRDYFCARLRNPEKVPKGLHSRPPVPSKAIEQDVFHVEYVNL